MQFSGSYEGDFSNTVLDRAPRTGFKDYTALISEKLRAECKPNKQVAYIFEILFDFESVDF